MPDRRMGFPVLSIENSIPFWSRMGVVGNIASDHVDVADHARLLALALLAVEQTGTTVTEAC
jgi:hypothetical protein